MDKKNNLLKKIVLFSLIFTFLFGTNAITAKAIESADKRCIYGRTNFSIITDISISGGKASYVTDQPIENRTKTSQYIEAYVKFKNLNSTNPEVDFVDLSDSMSLYGFGFSNTRMVDHIESPTLGYYGGNGQILNFFKPYVCFNGTDNKCSRTYDFTYQKYIKEKNNVDSGSTPQVDATNSQWDLCPPYMFVAAFWEVNSAAFGATKTNWYGWAAPNEDEVKDMYDDFIHYSQYYLSDWANNAIAACPSSEFHSYLAQNTGWNPRHYYYCPKDINHRAYLEILHLTKPVKAMSSSEAQQMDNNMANYATDYKNKCTAISDIENCSQSNTTDSSCSSAVNAAKTSFDDYSAYKDNAEALGFKEAISSLSNGGAGYNSLINILNEQTACMNGTYGDKVRQEDDLQKKQDELEDKCAEKDADGNPKLDSDGDVILDPSLPGCAELIEKRDEAVDDYLKNVDKNGWDVGIADDLLKKLGVKFNAGKLLCKDFCAEIDGAEKNLLVELFNLLKIIAPILVIILGTVDFVKAVLAEDQDALKKAGKNFGRRLAAAVLLFLLPTIISFLLYIANISKITTGQPAICVDKPISEVCK